MAEDDNDNSDIEPTRPKERQVDQYGQFTHKAFAYRRIGKRFGVYKEVGDSRVPPCSHCGAPYAGTIKTFIDRLIAFGGSTGGFLLMPIDKQPPQLPRDYPGQPEFDEKDILPES